MQSIGRQNNLRKIAGPVAGILVLLAAVFLATSLCSAASSPGMPRIFKPRVTKLGGSLPGQSGDTDENESRSAQHKEPVELKRHGYQIDIAIGDRPFTTYSFDPAVAKPYLIRDGDRGYRTPFVVPEEV